MTDYRPREAVSFLNRALESLPVVVLTGLRQSGKTTVLRCDPAFADRRYLSLDDFDTLQAARLDPDALIAGPDPLTLDEAQRAPDLLLAIKRAVDRDRTPGHFLLSGSAHLALLGEVSESLAGRALHVTLEPFTRREILGTGDAPTLTRLLESPESVLGAEAAPIAGEEVLRGGMPPVVCGDAVDPELWFLGYEQTYLERDVRELARVQDLVSFRTLLRLAAHRTGAILNKSEIARDARMPVRTASRHLDLLQASFVIRRAPPHLANRATRLVKSPKIHLTDAGLAGHLTSIRDIGPTSDEPLRGALYETYVVQNLAGILGVHRPQAELGFWSDQGRHEVDVVISESGRTLAIEIKAASRITRRSLAGLAAFRSKVAGEVTCVLAYNGTRVQPLGDRMFAVPLGVLLG